ncbi:MAG: hypothetical protein ACRD96_11230, partial [Bryobacteraceae bacterium]
AMGETTALDPADPLVAIGVETDSAGRVTKNSFGVLNLSWQAARHPEWAGMIAAETAEIRRRIAESHGARLRFLIWAGMGGSIEDKSMYNAAGLIKRVRCYSLDSTDPAKLKSILADMGRRGETLADLLRSTLVVGMAMGMTSYEPVVNLEKLAALYERCGVDSRSNFVYMTLPGSLLDQFASGRGYRKIELQPDGANSTAGRHSGPLTRGSLYPLALGGAKLDQWIQGAALDDEEIDLAWRLASFLEAQGAAGRDKITLLPPKSWAGAALWTKQNFEESLGKSEKVGLKVVIHERIRLSNCRAPKESGQDRVFLAVQRKGEAHPDADKITLLRRKGYPLAVLTLPAAAPLSRYMQFVHYVVCGLGYLRRMNFVTQPGVELYKAITARVHAEAGEAGGVRQTKAWRAMTGTSRRASWRGAVTLVFDSAGVEPDAAPADAPGIYASLVKKLGRRVEYA